MSATLSTAAPSVAAPLRARTWSHVATVAAANAGVAGIGFLGNWILTWRLDVHAFAAITLFLWSFQVLQDVLGRSLVWAMLRLAPRTGHERPGGGEAMVRAVWSVQCALATGGPLVVALGAWLLHPWVDGATGPPTTALVAVAGAAAAFSVLMQFDLGRLQLRERFATMSAWMVATPLLRVLAWLALWGTGLLGLGTAIAGHVLSTAVLAIALRRRTGGVPAATAALAADRTTVLRFARPMVLASTLAALAARVDIFVLDARAGGESTARYGVAILLVNVVELASSAVMTSLLPAVARARDAAERRTALHRCMRWGAAVAALGLLGYPVVEWLLPLVFPQQYHAAASLYPVLLAGVLVTALTDPLGLSFLSTDQPHRFAILNSLTLLTVLLGNLFAPGDDRMLVAAWVRTASRVLLGAGIVSLLLLDRLRSPRPFPPAAQ